MLPCLLLGPAGYCKLDTTRLAIDPVASPATGSIALGYRRGLLYVQREVVHDEGGGARVVLSAGQVDLDRLALVGGEVEGLLRVAGRGVSVRLNGERLEDRPGGTANLHGQ